MEAVDATSMPQFRSGKSVDAVPQQGFARAWRPSTLLQCHSFARENPSTLFRSKGSLGHGGRRRYFNATVSLGKIRRRCSAANVRSGMEAVDATSMPQFRSGKSVDALPYWTQKKLCKVFKFWNCGLSSLWSLLGLPRKKNWAVQIVNFVIFAGPATRKISEEYFVGSIALQHGVIPCITD